MYIEFVPQSIKIEDLSYSQKDELAATYAGMAAQERLQSSLDGVFTDLDTPNYDFEFDQDLDEIQKEVLAKNFAKNTVKQIIEDIEQFLIIFCQNRFM